MIDPEPAYRLIVLELGQRRAPGLRQAVLAWSETPADAARSEQCCVAEERNDAA